MSLGMDMMIGSIIKTFGLDPEQIKKQVAETVQTVQAIQAEHERQGRVIDAIARAHGIDPRAQDALHTGMIENGQVSDDK